MRNRVEHDHDVRHGDRKTGGCEGQQYAGRTPPAGHGVEKDEKECDRLYQVGPEETQGGPVIGRHQDGEHPRHQKEEGRPGEGGTPVQGHPRGTQLYQEDGAGCHERQFQEGGRIGTDVPADVVGGGQSAAQCRTNKGEAKRGDPRVSAEVGLRAQRRGAR